MEDRRKDNSVGARMRGQSWGAWGQSRIATAQDAPAEVERRQRPRGDRPAMIEGMLDPLTGLPSRALLADRLDRALKRARRSRQRAALLFVDLERCEEVFATHGRAAADELLVEASRRLQANLRATDTVARLGAHEFAVVLEGVHTPAAAELVAHRLAGAIAQPCTLLVDKDGAPLNVATHACIGIALFPDHAQDLDALVTVTDHALTQARLASGVRLFQEGADAARAAG